MKGIKESQRLSYGLLGLLCLVGIGLGLIVGLIDTIFGRTLLYLSDIRTAYPVYLIPFLGLAGLLIVWLYRKIGGASSKGMGLVFEVGHGQEDKIPYRLIPLVTLTTWLTHLFGGSAGREGVAVQLGATVGNAFGQFWDFTNKNRLFLTMGMAAGFAGLFQTPIAAIFFAMEVLALGQLSLTALLPAIFAAFTASRTSHYLGLEKFSFAISTDLSLDWSLILKLALLGICFGLAGNLFAYSLSSLKAKMASWLPNPYYRIFFVGLGLSLIFLLLWQGRYSGLGTNLIEASFEGEKLYQFDWLLKLLLTVLTLSIGFQGGEVTPLFAIGASLGAVLAPLFGLPVELVAAAGYISVFSSATNTFLAPIFIGGEVFGFSNVAYFFIAVAFAYSINRRQSIYGLQKILED
ncbi:chloride channel protein [Streptococcus loxodontisalivarius]|uniref:H+/Cl- antiporter ClcA n=1 Tax=Streptococcus loxodontisalivarius TaxID=1349415 RepID=A0ABS2PRK1_9STRE|nr:chloride channel protein [Streptococcus loxodontisalivarius]MBM7642180.1 H+/Cl- antiporter ClcA [Streptococcus loxodontisalivarius]